MADQIAFVSAPAATPTINLSLNQPSLLKVKRDSFSLGAPSFEGDPYTGTGGYGERTVELTLQATGTYDEAATVFQDVSQQLVNGAPGQGGRNWLMFRWSAADPPMFLWTLPSSLSALDFQNAGAGVWELPLSILCDGYIIGALEDISSFTITNSPSSGTNRMMVGPSVLGTIKGDAETPLMLAQTAAVQDGTPTDPSYLNSYSLRGGLTHSLLARNLTELTSSVDVGASVTGAGANYIDGDYKSCSFATPAMSERLLGTFSTALTPMPGLYRVLLRAVASQAGAGVNVIDYTFKISFTTASGIYSDPVVKQVVTAASGEYAIWADLGIVQVHSTSDFGALGLAAAASTSEAPSVSIAASASAVGTVQPLRFDELLLLPVATTYGTAQTALWGTGGSGVTTTRPIIIDGVNDDMKRVYDSTTTSPFAGVPGVLAGSPEWVGGLPTVVPGANNYLTVVTRGLSTTATTCTFSGRYYPRYLYLRPAST